MRKILFNDKYELTKAVLDGRKTMTRRIVNLNRVRTLIAGRKKECFLAASPYKVGEVVAIAQSYKDCGYDGDTKYGWCYDENEERTDVLYKDVPGWKNKMFVRSSRMPHAIRITDIKVERLQDISDEDCLREGVFMVNEWRDRILLPFSFGDGKSTFASPREAFASLIDKVGKKGTWESNPYVYAYTFELVK